MFKLDSDGYPTEETLKLIAKWGKEDGSWRELMEDISLLFELNCGRCQYNISREIWEVATGGWSGCEDLVGALEENSLFWLFCWTSSKRGGYFEFETLEHDD